MMTKWKRWSALFVAAVLSLSLLSGCGQEGENFSLSVWAGGEPVCLDPIYASQTGDQTILMNLYENLMRTASDGAGGVTVVNGMAKSVSQEENSDGTVTVTFKLRSARWSDGEKVTAQDFVYAWQRLADPASASPYRTLLSMVAGYDAVQESGDVTQLQVSAQRDDTLEVVLQGECPWFLTQVCTAPATLPLRADVIQAWKDAQAEEDAQASSGQEEPQTEASAEPESSSEEPEAASYWWSDPTALVTNGPFLVSSAANGESLTLTASETYSDSASGPRTLIFRFADTAEEALALYEAGEVDFLQCLPEEQTAQLIQENARTVATELGTWSVLVNCRQEPFADPLVRQALALSVDRAALAEAAGTTARAAEGLVPPGVPGDETQDFRTAVGAHFGDPAEAAADASSPLDLLEEAGYNSGADLGELELLYVQEDISSQVALALAQQWRTALGLEVMPRAVTAQELDAALESGSYTLAAAEVTAPGSDAACFLTQWVTGGADNVTGFANSAYDTLMTIIAGGADATARLGCLHDAEALLLEDGALIPLYTRLTAWRLRESYTGVCRDGRGYFLFSSVMIPTT